MREAGDGGFYNVEFLRQPVIGGARTSTTLAGKGSFLPDIKLLRVDS